MGRPLSRDFCPPAGRNPHLRKEGNVVTDRERKLDTRRDVTVACANATKDVCNEVASRAYPDRLRPLGRLDPRPGPLGWRAARGVRRRARLGRAADTVVTRRFVHPPDDPGDGPADHVAPAARRQGNNAPSRRDTLQGGRQPARGGATAKPDSWG